MAGGHCRTKMYMAASKSACTAPMSMIFGSLFTTFIASPIVNFSDCVSSSSDEESEVLNATFSFQRKVVMMAPRIKNPTDNSNGPVDPR